jgi:hypothetical protein
MVYTMVVNLHGRLFIAGASATRNGAFAIKQPPMQYRRIPRIVGICLFRLHYNDMIVFKLVPGYMFDPLSLKQMIYICIYIYICISNSHILTHTYIHIYIYIYERRN